MDYAAASASNNMGRVVDNYTRVLYFHDDPIYNIRVAYHYNAATMGAHPSAEYDNSRAHNTHTRDDNYTAHNVDTNRAHHHDSDDHARAHDDHDNGPDHIHHNGSHHIDDYATNDYDTAHDIDDDSANNYSSADDHRGTDHDGSGDYRWHDGCGYHATCHHHASSWDTSPSCWDDGCSNNPSWDDGGSHHNRRSHDDNTSGNYARCHDCCAH